MFIDLNIEDEIREAVEDYLADGGNRVITYEEYEDLLGRVKKIEEEWADMNFWKADRNHTHNQEGESTMDGNKT